MSGAPGVIIIYVQEEHNDEKSGPEEAGDEAVVKCDEICQLCLNFANLRPISESQFAQEFNNFRFIEVEIGHQLPERICEECFAKLDEIATFLIKCRNSCNLYKQQETISVEVSNQNVWEMDHSYIKKDTEINTKKCNKCGANVAGLQNHYKSSENCRPKNFKCSLCNLYFKSKYKVFVHETSSHWDSLSKTPQMCHICSKTFKYPASLRRHLNVHEYGRKYMCEICGKSYTKKSSLTDHKNIHSDVKMQQCPTCGESFKTKNSLFKHRQKHNQENKPKEEPPPLETETCNVCNREFSKKGLNMHMRTHEADKKLRHCKKCKIQFETFQLYKQHMQETHTDKNYVCLHCTKAFSSPFHLQKHSRIHSKELPFWCSYCGRKFRTKEHLQRHAMLLHNINRGEPYKCRFCGKGFASKGNLTPHERIHTGEKPYMCHVCSKGFIDSSSRKRHVRRYHGEDEVKNINI